jgi:stalled ribosome alternative rescue factor ArfA
MKQRKSKAFKVPAPKKRAHKALFDPDLPFKPKIEKNKKKYTRKVKHKEQP